jgi:hypothetical protein
VKILDRCKLEDCFDGSAVYQYEFADPWDVPRIQALARLGKLDYYADFPRPLFRVASASGLFIKGLAGTNHCRVIFPGTNREEVVRHFEAAMSVVDSAK